MRTSEQVDKLHEALAKAQGTMKNPEKNKTVKVPTKSGSSYSYTYADLPTIIDATREALSTHGLSHTITLDLLENGKCILLGRLMHSSGQWIESVYPLPTGVDDKTLAGVITYGRRYVLTALLGIAADEDTDSEPEEGAEYGNKKGPLKPKLPALTPEQMEAQRKLLLSKISGYVNQGLNAESIKQHIQNTYKLPSALDLNLDQLIELERDSKGELETLKMGHVK